MSELSGSLLQVLRPEKAANRTGVPLMLEFPVNPALAPFLVSSTKATLWVGARNGYVRAAVRKVPSLDSFFWEVIAAITQEGRSKQWGNVEPLTKVGIQTAIDHVRSYDLTELEILASPQMQWGDVHPDWAVGDKDMPLMLLGLPIQPAVWMPPSTIAVVPRDREFIGFVMLLQERVVAVVHNASRSVGIATSLEP